MMTRATSSSIGSGHVLELNVFAAGFTLSGTPTSHRDDVSASYSMLSHLSRGSLSGEKNTIGSPALMSSGLATRVFNSLPPGSISSPRQPYHLPSYSKHAAARYTLPGTTLLAQNH